MYTCRLSDKTTNGTLVAAVGYLDTLKQSVTFRSGTTNILKCGGPLKVVAEPRVVKSPLPAFEAATDTFQDKSELKVLVNGTVVGQGGETYMLFSKGRLVRNPMDQISPELPRVTVLDSKGTKLASGKLEYG